jgi:asparagine synthase (glutamine-hydrolysing)
MTVQVVSRSNIKYSLNMFGRVSLKNLSESRFYPNDTVGRRFSHFQAQGLRSQYFEDQDYICYLEGTLNSTSPGFNDRSLSSLVKAIFLVGPESWLQQADGLFFVYAIQKRKNIHLLLNNHYQLTHLYYAIEKEELLFSNEMSGLLPHLRDRKIHFPAALNFLRNGFNQSDQTQIFGVKKLLPTFWIEVSPSGWALKNRWPHHFSFARQPFRSLEKKVDEYEFLYKKSLNDYLEARKPEELATLLSGGHDTSFAMIQASKVFKKPVHAFTVTFPQWSFSEGQYAKSICEKFGGVFHAFPFQSSHLDLIRDMIEACEEPVLGSTLPLHALAQEVANTTDTLLGGDGGDTLWGEYFPVAEFHRWIRRLPLTVRKGLHFASRWLRDTTDWERFWELEHVAGLFAREDMYSHFMSRLCTYRHFSDDFLRDLLEPEFLEQAPAPSLLEIPFGARNFSNALIEGKYFNAFLTYQAFQQTRSINSFGIEFYLPTIQKDVVQFINSLPNEWLNGGTPFHRLINSKSINRRFHKHTLQRHLKREEIYNRSFDIPWHQLLGDRPDLMTALEESLLKRGWYQRKSLQKLFRDFKNQKHKDYELLELKSHGYRIMALLSLEIWCQKFLDSGTKKLL